jgi:hypothetical protein
VQEFATGGDLWSFMDTNSGRLTEQMTVSLVLQPFLRALHYLHASGIVHRWAATLCWQVLLTIAMLWLAGHLGPVARAIFEQMDRQDNNSIVQNTAS